MALVEQTLALQLKSLYKKMEKTEYTSEQFADEMAKIINNHILTASVSVTGTGNNGGPVNSMGSLS